MVSPYGAGPSKLMDAWIGSGVQAPKSPRPERVGSMDGIGLRVLTFAGQGTRPVAHPSERLPEEVRGTVRNRERAQRRNGQARL